MVPAVTLPCNTEPLLQPLPRQLKPCLVITSLHLHLGLPIINPPRPLVANELYRPTASTCRRSYYQLLLVDGFRVVSATGPTVVKLGFLDRTRYFFLQVAPQLSSRGWVDPVPGPLLFRKSGSAGNRTRDLLISSQELWTLDHRGGRSLLRMQIRKKCVFIEICIMSQEMNGHWRFWEIMEYILISPSWIYGNRNCLIPFISE
jgi:hypothetical protein